uniref:Reverse transcriptase domain-containing protein n=1 Tax=Tanacetum cinerariifolium TaxID=118510 RepID=A0A6L2JY33_TANCI|nr:reverse transcriptase domain-containing protein [Tanacetum cinerariifolium]
MLKFLQIFQRLHFDISFADALLHMLKFASTFKSLLSNKKKLFELASTPLNENCSAVLLKKFPKKLRDFGKFLIPCDFPELEECLALADLGASINLMPLSIWKKLSLPELTPTRMTLELANRSVAYPVGVAEDVFMKVGKFYFPTDFVVVDYDVDPRVPLILGRPFLRTERALIDVHDEELTLRVNDKAITFKVGHTSCYSRNYYEESINQINVIDVACEEYAQEVLGFSDSSTSGNPIPLDPIIASSSPSFTPFEGSDFNLEEIETFLPKNLVADHLSRSENPHEGDLEKKETNETFPLETLGMISFHGKSSTSCDRGTHFCNDQFAKVMLKYGVTHRLSTAYHPQTSGQVEVLNRGLKRILERTIGENQASWSDKLDDALWALCTAFKTPIGCTPYKLVYGKACHLPIKLEHKAYWSLKHCNFDLKTTGDHRKVQMNELNELWDQAYENSLIYKEKTKKIHDSKIKNRVFNVGV